MARPLRFQFPGGTYHVYCRGNAKQCVFLDSEDYARFGRLLARVAARLDCFGPNRRVALARLKAFVEAGRGEPPPTTTAMNRSILGDEAFANRAEVLGPASREVSRADRRVRSLADFARAACSRNDAIRTAYASGMYTQMLKFKI